MPKKMDIVGISNYPCHQSTS